MAASLCGRRFVIDQTRRLYLSVFNSHLRFFSTDKDGNDSSKYDSEIVTDKKIVNNEEKSEDTVQPVIDNAKVDDSFKKMSRFSVVSPAEAAVDKFFKVVKKVQELQDEAESSKDLAAVVEESINNTNITPRSRLAPTEDSAVKFFEVVKKVEGADSNEQDAGVEEDTNESFATMFRKSKFVSLGEFQGRFVKGKIIEVMDDDLYIDFGGKFHCVCPRPKRNPHLYYRGTEVLINLQAMEMSSAFLGSDIHVTLLEADGTLVGLADSSKLQRFSKVKQ